MKAEYKMVIDNKDECSFLLRKFLDGREYFWVHTHNKWIIKSSNSRIPDRPTWQNMKTITEEEAFRYILEH